MKAVFISLTFLIVGHVIHATARAEESSKTVRRVSVRRLRHDYLVFLDGLDEVKKTMKTTSASLKRSVSKGPKKGKTKGPKHCKSGVSTKSKAPRARRLRNLKGSKTCAPSFSRTPEPTPFSSALPTESPTTLPTISPTISPTFLCRLGLGPERGC
jgi:hypothetical protein